MEEKTKDAPRFLGISGIPVEESNTDTLIKTIMEATGAEQEIVKLSDIKVGPCLPVRSVLTPTSVCRMMTSNGFPRKF